MSDEMDEIWALFADDGAQAMDAMETALLALDGLPEAEQAQHVAALFRAVHTFKGNSRVLGLGVVESRAHLAEDLIGLVRDQGVQLDAEIHALLLETADRLRDMLETTAATHADVDPAGTEPLMDRLRDKIRRCVPQAGEADPASPVAPVEVEALPPPEVSMARPDLPAEPDMPAATDATPSEMEAGAPAGPGERAAAVSGRLADDPAYRGIFNDMVADSLRRLRGLLEAGTPGPASRTVADLDHAARQLGLDDWSAGLSRLPSAPSAQDVAAIISVIEGLAAREAPRPSLPLAAGTHSGFFTRIEPPLSAVARIGISFSTGEAPDAGTLAAAVEGLCAVADAEGYVRVSSAASAVLSADDAASYRRAELRLYEELAAVETVLGADSTGDGFSPASLLASWCAEHVFDTLDELDATLERLRSGGDVDAGQRALERLARLVHHACRYYGLETASQLAMSLLDLFGRGHARGEPPDAILMRIARGFIDTLELVFDALREGEVPDTKRLEQLFAEASEAGFTGVGVMTATAIERKLGLPSEFHRVLSPDSTRAAAEALARGLSFHLLRADVNTDNDLAEALFAFIGSGAIVAITNVTVFKGEETLFDFLIATSLGDIELAEAMAHMDPGGRRLVLLRKLELSGEPGGTAPEASAENADPWPDTLAGADLSAGMLERIGEIAAGQAMVHGMLGELAANDFSESIDAVMRLHGDNPREARLALRGMAEEMMLRLRDLAQLETQLLGHLAELQQTTAEMRARPVDTMLRPMAAMTATQSRKHGREARMTTAGGEIPLDISLLESLKRILRPLVLARLAQGESAPRRLHLAVNRSDDQLSVTLEDDGGAPPASEGFEAVEAEIARANGKLRIVRRPGGGQRFHLVLPMNMVVLEGMVVGAGGTRYVLPVEAIRTILQPDPSALITVSVQGGQRWLRLSEDEVIAIRTLPAANGSPLRPAVAARPDAEADPSERKQSRVHVVLGRVGQSIAIPVDDLVGQQLVLLRPLRGVMSKLRNVTGVALLSGGDVGMVLSPAALCGWNDMDERPATAQVN